VSGPPLARNTASQIEKDTDEHRHQTSNIEVIYSANLIKKPSKANPFCTMDAYSPMGSMLTIRLEAINVQAALAGGDKPSHYIRSSC